MNLCSIPLQDPFYSDASKFYIRPQHFTVFNRWKEDKTDGVFNEATCEINNSSKFVTDTSTGDRYLNEPRFIIRIKCLISALTFPIHLLFAPVNLMCTLWVAVTNPDERLSHTIARIVATPFILLGHFFSLILGILSPLDGRKLAASFERLNYHKAMFHPCFQPSSDHHQRKKLVPSLNLELRPTGYP